MNGYELSRDWFNFCFENPEKIRPTHTALYFFAIEHCNRLAWKEVFGLPTTMAMEAIGIRSYKTYKQTLTDIVDWGFLRMVEVSKNQHSSNKVALVKNTEAHTEALDKAMLKHVSKQVQSTVSINKHINQSTEEPITEESMYRQIQEATSYIELIPLWQEYRRSKGRFTNLIEADVIENSWRGKDLAVLKQEILHAIENGWLSLVPIKESVKKEQSVVARAPKPIQVDANGRRIYGDE
jgi:hypothetical protein